MPSLTPKERLRRQARGQEVDCIPSIGGWMEGAANLAELAGISLQAYLADPLAGVVRANRALGVDGMVSPVVPRTAEEIRSGSVQESHFAGVEPEALRDHAESLPQTEAEVLASFSAEEQERRLRGYFESALRSWDGLVPIPNFWDLGGHFPLYTQFGYVAFLSACALYPEHVGRIWWVRSLHSRERAKILARLYREYDLVPLHFCGEDLCNRQGPMLSPRFLRRHYLPTVRMIIEPLVNEGVRLIHHCDGDVRPLVRDFLEIGFSGFQGFQYEFGVRPEELLELRTPFGDTPLLMGGLSVSRTLPFGTEEDVRAEVDYLVDVTGGGRGLFLFTSNVTGVEVPPDSLRSGYGHVKTRRYGEVGRPPRLQWPWEQTHDEAGAGESARGAEVR